MNLQEHDDPPHDPKRRTGSLPKVELSDIEEIDPSLARRIDHTCLGPVATRHDIERLCAEARAHGFFSVCVPPAYVALAASLLQGSRAEVCTVVGFPMGYMTPRSKAQEAREAVALGASEIDMVMNIGALKSGDFELVTQDIQAVVAAVPGQIVKVILECALLDDREIMLACALAKGAGAHFVKTSTGFASGGATALNVQLMRQTVGPEMGVKASGGIRTREDAWQMLDAGANRLGCSASVAIVTDTENDSGAY